MKDRIFRTRTQKLGGYWHVRVFSADRPDHTFANIGTLVMDEDDYLSFVTRFQAEHLSEAAMTERREIFSERDRRVPLRKVEIGECDDAEAFAADHTRHCKVCRSRPVVNATGLCGPCTFGEAETINGNW